jgi:hypothetical protein
MSTPSIQTLITQAQQVLNLKSSNEIRATLAAVLANANVGTPLNPNLTTQQLWDEFYEIVRQPSDDIMSIITDQMMRMVFSPPAPGGAGADKQVIFNDGGLLAGDAGLMYNKATDALTITGDLTVRTNKLLVTATGVGVGAVSVNPFDVTSTSGTLSVFKRTGSNGAFIGIQDASGSLSYLGSTNGTFSIQTAGSGYSDKYTIATDGTATWSVGGTTAMTLNSTGLGIGNVPVSGQRLTVEGGDIYLKSANKLTLDNASNNFGAQIYNIGASAQAALAFKLGASQAMTLDASGNLLVGKTASSTSVAGAQVQPDGTHSAVKSDANPGFFYNTTTAISGTVALFRSNGVTVGSISQDGTNTAYNLSSDYRLKEQVQPLVGGLARVNSLKPSIYKWKTNGSNGEGFLAHELAEVVSFAVTGQKDAMNEDGTINPQGVDLSKIVPILVAAIQELTAEVNALKNA